MRFTSPPLADLLGTPVPWQERALCAQVGFVFFHVEPGGSADEAKKVCSMCEVKAECLAHALANDEPTGIWGGTSEFERRAMKPRTKAAA